ncbi:MAG: 2,3-bisphosphoglycerate-independent phosphoglycerate mutase [Oscillospiraceae bacterium]|jgi:2,3-bisphosphoglycerate-independent phosphoglycerate mutase|nr:2,3-bisphosphoglycerate-independent phosphoglycerate mutase [Oscillospiraceae bacterium]
MINKVICVIYDGLGDRPIAELGGRTPLEAAVTPNFDAITKKSVTGLMHTLGRGTRPGSDVSHLAIFGYPMEKYYTGRGPIEVAGLGIKLATGDVAFRGNFGTVDIEWNILDRRAGRILDVSEFAEAVDGMVIDGVTFAVKAGTAHRAGVIMRGEGLSANISDADPHEGARPVETIRPLDDTPEAKRTADALNKFLRRSYELLDHLPANDRRRAAGELPANFLLLRGAGIYPTMPSFEEKYGLHACCIAGGGLYRGVGAFLGMDLIDVEGANALPTTNVRGKFETALKMLDTHDFVFVHVKATDTTAEDGDWAAKKAFIEKVDGELKLFTDLPPNVLLVMTADHSTACELKAHTADPVPVLFCNPSARVDDVEVIGERAFARGGLGFIEGKDVMPQVLNLMGRLHLLGA